MIMEDNLGADGDRIYEALMDAHEGLSEEESNALNTRLVLLMANAIGDPDKLEALFATARSYANR